jgi:hypothetical protein
LKTCNIFTGFTSLVVLSAACFRFEACLGAWFAYLGHRGDLGSFVRELTGPNWPISHRIFSCFNALPAFPFGKVLLHKCLYLGYIADFKRKKHVHIRLKPNNTLVVCREKPEISEVPSLRSATAPSMCRRLILIVHRKVYQVTGGRHKFEWVAGDKQF